MNLLKFTSRLLKVSSVLSAVCVIAATYPANAQESRSQNITGEGFQGGCTLDGNVSLQSGPSFRSTSIGATTGAIDTIKVHSTESHNGLWSWITVHGVEDINAWVDSDQLYDCEGPELHKDIPYAQAREFILSQGWRPVEVDPDNAFTMFGVDYLISLGFTEVVDCSGTGIGLCFLRFYNTQGEILNVYTANNNPGWNGPNVYSWRRVSPQL